MRFDVVNGNGNTSDGASFKSPVRHKICPNPDW
jgi:hypothetical protein